MEKRRQWFEGRAHYRSLALVAFLRKATGARDDKGESGVSMKNRPVAERATATSLDRKSGLAQWSTGATPDPPLTHGTGQAIFDQSGVREGGANPPLPRNCKRREPGEEDIKATGTSPGKAAWVC